MTVKPTFSGEAQFAGYSDSSRGGPRVTLRLADRADLEKFIGCEGKRYMAVLVEIMDDETPAVEHAPAPPPKPAARRERMAPLCEWAVMRCSEPTFQSWIAPVYDKVMGGDGHGTGDIAPVDVGGHAAFARHALLVICGIESRKDLDTDPAAAKKLHERVRRPYAAWREKQAVPA